MAKVGRDEEIDTPSLPDGPEPETLRNLLPRRARGILRAGGSRITPRWTRYGPESERLDPPHIARGWTEGPTPEPATRGITQRYQKKSKPGQGIRSHRERHSNRSKLYSQKEARAIGHRSLLSSRPRQAQWYRVKADSAPPRFKSGSKATVAICHRQHRNRHSRRG